MEKLLQGVFALLIFAIGVAITYGMLQMWIKSISLIIAIMTGSTVIFVFISVVVYQIKRYKERAGDK